MTSRFNVLVTPNFERQARSLRKRHPDFSPCFLEAIRILGTDPHNRSRAHAIRKLEGISKGEGLYRLRIRRWRFRYDIYDRDVVLLYCGLRRENTYR
jgi:mRNA-degrading endonuclease RelE of RelBE toxin-antitoxin system